RGSGFRPWRRVTWPCRPRRQGYPNPGPAGTPYSPFDTVAALNQSLAGVGLRRLLTWSRAPLAADIAELMPRALMTAAPRPWIIGTNVLSSQARSVMTSGAGRPLTAALVKSGYCVLLWLPQMVTRVTSALATPAFFARAVRARLWSRRVIAVQRSAGMSRPLE